MKTKDKIKVIIETAPENYAAYLEDIDGIVCTGSTIEEIEKNMREAIDLSVEVSKEIGEPVPEQLQGEYELESTMDASTSWEM